MIYFCFEKCYNTIIDHYRNKRRNGYDGQKRIYHEYRQYDRPVSFFYCDPPYFATENYYKDVGFKTKDHIRLRDSLMDIKGKFLVSYNDCPEIRELWDKPNIHIEEISRINNLAQRYDGGSQYAELLISNYDTSERLRAVRQLSLFDDETDNFGGIIL